MAMSLAKASSFPWLSANVRNRHTGKPLFGKPYRVLQAGPLSIAVIGITTRIVECIDEHVVLSDELEALQECLDEIKENQQVDVIVVAYHGGIDRDLDTGKLIAKPFENRGLEILRRFDCIDVLITGHQHRTFAFVDGCKAVVQPGAFADGLAEVRLDLNKDEQSGKWLITRAEAKIWSKQPALPDSEFLSQMEPFIKEAQEWENQTLAVLEHPVLIEDILHHICMNEHPLIRWMHSVQMRVSGANLSVASFPNEQFKGFADRNVTRRDIMKLFPYPDKLQTVEILGSDILKALEYSATLFEYDEGSIPAVRINKEWQSPHFRIYDYTMWAGIDYAFDLTNPPGRRVQKCEMAKGPVQPNRVYKVVLSDFLANLLKTVLMIDIKCLGRIDKELPDLLMEDALNGGLARLDLYSSRSFICQKIDRGDNNGYKSGNN